MALTKNIRRGPGKIRQWQSADFTAGEILGIRESLGKSAVRLTVEAIGGDAVIRFNVSKMIYKDQQKVGNTFMPDAGFWQSPVEAGEVELTTEDILIEAGSVQTWDNEFPIDDIKIITKPSIMRVTVV